MARWPVITVAMLDAFLGLLLLFIGASFAGWACIAVGLVVLALNHVEWTQPAAVMVVIFQGLGVLLALAYLTLRSLL